jgi:hypothetical protein
MTVLHDTQLFFRREWYLTESDSSGRHRKYKLYAGGKWTDYTIVITTFGNTRQWANGHASDPKRLSKVLPPPPNRPYMKRRRRQETTVDKQTTP